MKENLKSHFKGEKLDIFSSIQLPTDGTTTVAWPAPWAP